jgi:hypothetical protein
MVANFHIAPFPIFCRPHLPIGGDDFGYFAKRQTESLCEFLIGLVIIEGIFKDDAVAGA